MHAVIEMHKARRVRVFMEPRILRESVPEHARTRVVLRLLKLNGRMPQPAALLEVHGRCRRIALHQRDARTIKRMVGSGRRRGKVTQVERNGCGRARATERAVANHHRLQRAAKLFLGNARALKQLPEVRERLVVLPIGERTACA